jgi:hypothetical protein
MLRLPKVLIRSVIIIEPSINPFIESPNLKKIGGLERKKFTYTQTIEQDVNCTGKMPDSILVRTLINPIGRSRHFPQSLKANAEIIL